MAATHGGGRTALHPAATAHHRRPRPPLRTAQHLAAACRCSSPDMLLSNKISTEAHKN